MKRISVDSQTFPVEVVAFDKDGTLIDFQHLWGRKAEQWLDILLQMNGGDSTLQRALEHSIGYDPSERQVIADSPMAVAANAKLCTVAAVVLYQHGVPWHQAEPMAQAALDQIIQIPLTADMIRPVGNVQGTVRYLRQNGFRLAVVTSDDRKATEFALDVLGVRDCFELLICGDDNIPHKPYPTGMWHLCHHFDVEAGEVMMVGDTLTDMAFGRHAGTGACIGITGGAGDAAALATHADAVVSSIDVIRVVDQEEA